MNVLARRPSPPSLPATQDPAQRPLRLGFLCPHNPHDRRAFSGTAFFAARALARHPGIDLRLLGDPRPPGRFDRLLRRRPPGIDPDRLNTAGLDLILGLVASRLLDGRAEHLGLPYIHVTDATPGFLRDVYGWRIPEAADAMEARVTATAAATVYSSHEMAARARDELSLSKARTLPFGINMEHLPEQRPDKTPGRRLELLFVGTDWIRKGGDRAVACLEQLQTQGRPARLTVAGRLPETYRRHPDIRAVGYLDKNRPRQARRLARLYRQADLLLLPSRADCTPMVAAEALAHGTPVLASQIGGIGTLLGKGQGGYMLPPGSPAEEWARAALWMTTEPDRYRMLSDAGFERSRTYLSWDSWAAGIAALGRSLGQRPGLREAAA